MKFKVLKAHPNFGVNFFTMIDKLNLKFSKNSKTALAILLTSAHSDISDLLTTFKAIFSAMVLFLKIFKQLENAMPQNVSELENDVLTTILYELKCLTILAINSYQ